MTEEKIETGIDWEAVKADMETEDWETDWQNEDMEVRQVFLGTVFSLFPSGKFYMPFACSNLDPCETCEGTGQTAKVFTCSYCQNGKRVAADYMSETGLAEQGVKIGEEFTCNVCKGTCKVANECPDCGGMGSREAYLDELYRDQLESEADEHGYCIENGEGDPCDIFIAEYREQQNESEGVE